jgi:hypothetical protein
MLIQIWAAINNVAGRSTTGNVGGRLIRRGVCFDQRQKNWVPCRDRLLGLEESSCRRTYDAVVLATIARHGTTIKWSSPQANDRWGGLGSGLRWRASRRVQKKRGSTRWRLRDRRSMHSTRSLRAWRYYASSSILGLVGVVSVQCINQIPGVPSSLSVRRKFLHFVV